MGQRHLPSPIPAMALSARQQCEVPPARPVECAPGQAEFPLALPQAESPAPRQAIGVASQCDGHQDVVLRSSPNQGQIVAKVPNGEKLVILQREGEHLKVRWNQIEAWAKACNVQQRHLPSPIPDMASAQQQCEVSPSWPCMEFISVVVKMFNKFCLRQR